MFLPLLGSVCGSVVGYYWQHSKVTDLANIAQLKLDIYGLRGPCVSEKTAIY